MSAGAVSTPSGIRIWLMAARIRTLPAAVAPVLVGTALAGFAHRFHALRFVAALIGAIFIQVGTNLHNDYSDARRGADTDDRLGPVRVTAGGLVPPRQVLVATYISFGVAVLAGVYLVAVAGWQLLLVGAASILAGVLYTGGPRPYGYEGLGELFVFLFFGIVAVAGSYFVQVKHLSWEAFALAVPVGLLAAAILVVNNYRDIDTDRRAGKRTLAVRLGRARTRALYATLVYGSFLLAPITWLFGPLRAWLLLPWLTLPVAAPVVRVVRNRTDGALAQSGARPNRHAPAGVLHAAGSGPAAEQVKRRVFQIEARLRAPFVSAAGALASRKIELIELDGLGHGEDDDQASWDLRGRRAGQPVWRLLGASEPLAVEVNATIGAGEPEQAATEARTAHEAGFRCVKVKVGMGDDRARIHAVREAVGPDLAIRIDANGAWSVEQAIAALAELEPLGIECCEEPVSGALAIARVSAATSIPIALDETTAEPGALDRRVCRVACLKLARLGGITGVLQAARRARRAGYEIYLASLLDGPLGIAAALHAAAVIRPERPCGLATLPMFEGRAAPIAVAGGRMSPPPGPGLGDGLLPWYGA